MYVGAFFGIQGTKSIWNVNFGKKIKNQTIWFLRVSRIWKILTSLFKSLLNYKLRQNIWNKIEKSSRIGQYEKSLLSTFRCFLTEILDTITEILGTISRVLLIAGGGKEEGIRNFDGEKFLPGDRNLRRCDFGDLNLFSKLKTAFCEYWTSIKIKINMT